MYYIMKRTLLLLFLFLSLLAHAYDAKINGIYYNFVSKSKTAEVTWDGTPSGGAYMRAVTIPSTVMYEGVEYSVTGIGDYAFYRCSDLSAISIPNSVTNIGNSAFQSCSGLTAITVPNTVTRIGSDAFYGCTALTSVTIGNSVNSIGSHAFYYCNKLATVNISDIAAWCKISFADDYANPLLCSRKLFLNGILVKDLVIPNSVTSISEMAFSYCFALTSVSIPNTVTSIGDLAFEGCTGLISVNIPNSVTNIGSRAFEACSKLTSIDIPNSMTSISSGAFSGCFNLISVNIPNSITSIDDNAFQGCYSMTSVSIPNSVTNIGYYAFEGCYGISSIFIGSGVKTIQSTAFAGCKNLEDVYCYAEEVPSAKSNAFNNSLVEYATLYVPEGSISAYQASEPWNGFGMILPIEGKRPDEPEVKVCEVPIITYADGKLQFSCATEGAEIISEIKATDNGTYYDNEVTLAATYQITAYATKIGFDNSEKVTAALSFNLEDSGDNSDDIISVKAHPVLITTQGSTVHVRGLQTSNEVRFATIDGKTLGSARVTDGEASFNTQMPVGSIVVVSTKDGSAKVRL